MAGCNEDRANKQQEYIRNRDSFVETNTPVLTEAYKMRKAFSQTLRYNENYNCFYKEIKDVKIMIMTATEIERETLFAFFTKIPKSFELVENNVIKRVPFNGLVYSFFYINDAKVVHVEPEIAGSNAKGGTADTLSKALKDVKPAVVVSVGVCFGCDKDKEDLCDVLVGRQFFSYDKSSKIKDMELNVKRLNVFESSETLLYKMKSTTMFEDKTTGLFENSFKPHIGNLVTGEFVVDSQEFREMIFEPFVPFGIIGGEMESFGLFETLKKYNEDNKNKQAHGIMIKGISDWGVGKNSEAPKNENGAENSISKIEDDKIPGETLTDFPVSKSAEKRDPDYDKNNLQTLAMCNACTICKNFLAENNFFSDFENYNKGFWRRIENYFKYKFKKKDKNLSRTV